MTFGEKCAKINVMAEHFLPERKSEMKSLDKFLNLVSPIAENDGIAEKYAAHLAEFFEYIDPFRISEDLADLLKAEDYERAVAVCADYFRNRPDFSMSSLAFVGNYSVELADNASVGKMREINIDWEFEDGRIDYLFDPTEIHGPRNHEWLWQFNRHSYWRSMACAYRDSMDEKYAKAFRYQMLAWIAQTDIPDNWNGPGSAWRTIECGLRLLGSWPVSFDSFKKSKNLDDVSLLLMIASMHRQSLHLVAHPTGGNWLMMESNGVYTFSALFDEFRDSKENRNLAAERLIVQTERQILPDGMHDELSPDYQGVVFGCASNFYCLAQELGMKGEISAKLEELLKRTAHASILLSTPAFTQPKTNDTYLIHTEKRTLSAAEMFGNLPEYAFVNTKRAEGAPPAGETASAFLPYAGFAVMRSDWSADAAYLCFDVGPLGMGHMHQDKLNIILFKGDEELLYDDGGGQYEISPARNYGLSSFSHNVILVDGRPQDRRTPLRSENAIDASWITNEQFDYAKGVYDDVWGGGVKPATHTREVRFCKPGFFCVKDTMTSTDGNAHNYDLMLHMDTTSVKEIAEYPNATITEFGRKYELVAIPVDENSNAVKLSTVSGQTTPIYQGWYNGRNESNLHPAITVMRRVTQVKDFKFTTLLFPVAAGDPMPVVRRRDDGKIDVEFEGKQYLLNLDALDQ